MNKAVNLTHSSSLQVISLIKNILICTMKLIAAFIETSSASNRFSL